LSGETFDFLLVPGRDLPNELVNTRLLQSLNLPNELAWPGTPT
jgi:hypothetical protein